MLEGREGILEDIIMDADGFIKPVTRSLDNGRILKYEHPTTTRYSFLFRNIIWVRLIY